MAATSQIFWWEGRDGTITARAFWKDRLGKLDPRSPGRFEVFNGSFDDFGIDLPAGFEVRGFEFRKDGHIKVIISGVRTGTRIRKDEKVSVK